MKKKSLLLAIAAMSMAAVGVGTVGTFAWYQSSSAAALSKTATTTGALTVKDQQGTLGGVKFIVAPTTGYATSLIYTNRAGKTYFRSGDVYTPMNDDDFEVGANHKQATMTFDVKIVDANDNTKSPSVNSLASVPGTYTISVAASGSAKVDLAKTEALGTDTATPCVNFANPTTAAQGVLGALEDASVDIMKIYIDASGNVSYKTNAVAVTTPSAVDAWGGDATPWSNSSLKTAVTTFSFFYALEVKSSEAENATSGYDLQDNTMLVPSVAGVDLSSNAYTIS